MQGRKEEGADVFTPCRVIETPAPPKQNKAAYPSRQSTSRPHRPRRSRHGPLGLSSLRGISRACVSLLPPALVLRKRRRSAAYPCRRHPLPHLAKDRTPLYQKDASRASHPAEPPAERQAREIARREDEAWFDRRRLRSAWMHRPAYGAETHPRPVRRRGRKAPDPRRVVCQRSRPRPGLSSRHEFLRDSRTPVGSLPCDRTRSFRQHCL
jgi:hypothetical protein